MSLRDAEFKGKGTRMNWRKWMTVSLLMSGIMLQGAAASTKAAESERTDLAPPPDGMVTVPAGEFQMGDPFNEGGADERPVHAVYLDTYYIDIHEVTNEQYCAFLNSAYDQGLIEVPANNMVYQAGGAVRYCRTENSVDSDGWPPQNFMRFENGTFTVTNGRENHPVTQVSWYGAVAYTNWRSEQDGRTPCYDLTTWMCDFSADGYRLPTEAEWEKAAAWDPELQRHFRYGEQSDGFDAANLPHTRANFRWSADPYESSSPATTPVGYYDGSDHAGTFQTEDAKSYYGCRDMTGNVWEWCNDWYSADYYSSSPYDNPTGPAEGTMRTFRGGSWGLPAHWGRTARRGTVTPGNIQSGGFRCVTRYSPTSGECPGDIDGNGTVNLDDFAILALNFGSGPGATLAQGDLNEDGFVNLDDFAILALNFSNDCN